MGARTDINNSGGERNLERKVSSIWGMFSLKLSIEYPRGSFMWLYLSEVCSVKESELETD